MNTLPWLLKREYWEHRGGFLWAPVWTAVALLFLVLSGIVVGEILGRQAHIQFGVPLNKILANASPSDLHEAALALNGTLLGFASFINIVLAFVLFFYLIGALYDDRRDRSVLFWKSLPVSDTDTVISKVLTAAFVAPLLAFGVIVLMHIGLLLLLSLLVAFHGGNPFTLIWGEASPVQIWLKVLAAIPLNALWALPAYGWLLLCSAWSRSKPFLWAVVVPILVGWFLALSDVLNHEWIPRLWYWRDVVARILLSVVPGSWAWHTNWAQVLNDSAVQVGPQGMGLPHDGTILPWSLYANALVTPALWIGAVAGIAMIVLAIWLRGRRIETAT